MTAAAPSRSRAPLPPLRRRGMDMTRPGRQPMPAQVGNDGAGVPFPHPVPIAVPPPVPAQVYGDDEPPSPIGPRELDFSPSPSDELKLGPWLALHAPRAERHPFTRELAPTLTLDSHVLPTRRSSLMERRNSLLPPPPDKRRMARRSLPPPAPSWLASLEPTFLELSPESKLELELDAVDEHADGRERERDEQRLEREESEEREEEEPEPEPEPDPELESGIAFALAPLSAVPSSSSSLASLCSSPLPAPVIELGLEASPPTPQEYDKWQPTSYGSWPLSAAQAYAPPPNNFLHRLLALLLVHVGPMLCGFWYFAGYPRRLDSPDLSASTTSSSSSSSSARSTPSSYNDELYEYGYKVNVDCEDDGGYRDVDDDNDNEYDSDDESQTATIQHWWCETLRVSPSGVGGARGAGGVEMSWEPSWDGSSYAPSPMPSPAFVRRTEDGLLDW